MTENDQNTPEPIPPSVELIGGLLARLYPEPGPDILTLDDFKRRYRLTGLGSLAVRAIQQSQRINRSSGRFNEIGLCEFHIGLIYLEWSDYQGAIQQFREARIQWSFIDKTGAICLAYLAEGLAHHHRYAYELALSQYGKVESYQKRIKYEPSFTNRIGFVAELNEILLTLQEAARKSLWEPRYFTSIYYQPPDLPICDDCVWFRVEKADTNFLPSINEGDWLIVSKKTVNYEFSDEDMIVILKPNIEDEGIVLHPLHKTQPFARIHLLAKPRFTGRFSISNGTVNLSSSDTPLSIEQHEIEGIVVGWHQPT